MAEAIERLAIIGTGVIGAGWAARCLAHGLDVVAFDPFPGAEMKLRAAVDNAWTPLTQRGLEPGDSLARLSFAASLAECVGEADFIQENAPEREALKQNLLAEIDAAAPPRAIIASSTSGLLPTILARKMRDPGRLVVGHPFNPVYLLPLVEIVAGEKTRAASVDAAKAFYASIGMRPLVVRKEVEGFIADRLMEALWR
jgi:carnitine 3-dehydrogenase